MKKKLLLMVTIIIACLITATALVGCLPSNLKEGQNVDVRKFSKFSEFKAFIFRKDDVSMPYRLYSPKNDDGAELPLVIFLHGRGESGIDNKKNLEKTFASEILKYQENQKCYVLVPQTATGKDWSYYINNEKSGDVLDALVEDLATNKPINRSRMYMTGMSMGGFGVMENLTKHTAKYAGASILCGGISAQSDAKKIALTPTYFYHSKDDKIVDYKLSQDANAAIILAGGESYMQTYTDLGHAIWSTVYQDLSMWDWLFSLELSV